MPTEPQSHLETEQLLRRNRELAILNSIAEALNHQVDLTPALHTVLDQVSALLYLTTGRVWLILDKTGESSLPAPPNLPPKPGHPPDAHQGNQRLANGHRRGPGQRAGR